MGLIQIMPNILYHTHTNQIFNKNNNFHILVTHGSKNSLKYLTMIPDPVDILHRINRRSDPTTIAHVRYDINCEFFPIIGHLYFTYSQL